MPGIMATADTPPPMSEAGPSIDLDRLRAVRNRLADALND
jgi:hypothetical protein